MAALPARLRALALVPRPPGWLSGPPAQGHDRGPGAKAPDRALAIPPGRGRAAGDGAEASLTKRRLQRHRWLKLTGTLFGVSQSMAAEQSTSWVQKSASMPLPR